MNKKWLGSFLLLITAIVWGFCFVVQRSGMDYVGAFTYGAARFLLGGLALIPLALARPCEKQKRRKSLLAGLPCGLALFAGTSLQQLGLKTVSAGKAGFLSAMYIVLVPVLGLFIGQKVKARVWISAALGAVGLYLLCTGGADGSVSDRNMPLFNKLLHARPAHAVKLFGKKDIYPLPLVIFRINRYRIHQSFSLPSKNIKYTAISAAPRQTNISATLNTGKFISLKSKKSTT